jgi:hypothetical protein
VTAWLVAGIGPRADVEVSSSPVMVDDTVVLTFSTDAGQPYQAQYTTDPVAGTWQDLPGPLLIGDGNLMQFHDPSAAPGARLYRLQLGTLPDPPGPLTNLILNQPYTYHPIPGYSTTTDAGDTTQLTDGSTSYLGGSALWFLQSTVGWSAGVIVPIVILFDLGQEASLSNLRFNTTGGGSAGVNEAGIRVFVSLDDQSYVLAGEVPPPVVPPEGSETRYGIQLQVNLNGVRGRYVAVVPMPPPPSYFTFVDEIQLFGQIPPNPASSYPGGPTVTASGAQELQEALEAGQRASTFLEGLVAPVERHILSWPEPQASDQDADLDTFRGRVFNEYATFDALRLELTENHRVRASQVYGAEALVWEVLPDEAFTMLSFPESLNPPQTASIHTVVNALEATAVGAANLAPTSMPVTVSVSGGGAGAPAVTPRVARFFETTNARYIPDALLATDQPHTIPSGESRLIWLLAESTGATPGTHAFPATVSVGTNVMIVPLTVEVEDVTLSATNTPLSTGNWSDLNTGVLPGYDDVRDSMLDHRITVGMATGMGLPERDGGGNVIRPVQIDFTDIDQFITFHGDFPQIGWFYPYDPHSNRPHHNWFGPADWMSQEFQDIFGEWLTNFVGHVRASGRDYDEFLFQMFDETLVQEVADLCALIKSIDPNVRVMCTVPQAHSSSVSHFVAAGMDIFNFHAPHIEYDNGQSGFPTLSSGGRELWFYGAADAAFGVGKEQDPLGWYRYLNWTAWFHGATGVHFWNMLHNNGGSPVWGPETVSQVYWPLVYHLGPQYPAPPPDIQTSENVIPSRRYEYVRMGIEDYMLLEMAQDEIDALGGGGAAFQQQLDDLVMTVLTNRADDRMLFRQKRQELVDLVETLTP